MTSGPTNRRSRALLPPLVALALIATACTASRDELTGDTTTATIEEPTAESSATPDPTDDQDEAEIATVEIEPALRPGPFQLTIDEWPSDLEERGPATVEVLDETGAPIGAAEFAANGTALVRELPAGPAQVRIVTEDGPLQGPSVEIPGETVTDPGFYGDADLSSGFNYITTRDGTELSAFISLPGSATAGPYPTLVEYSGYAPSDPTAAADPYRVLIPALGYALVQVNVRGTGCSGGSFDAFEPIQSLDGYDVIETVAAQAWSSKVGMFGVSYPGIMQLHVASTRPPSLAAIAPLSPLGRVDSVLYPGGIFNNGFGQEWSDQVGSRAEANGQEWAADRVARGDQTCAANQELRVHNPDLVEVIRQTPFINDLAIERSAETHADRINVPTLIGGAWQDEQTGGRFVTLLDELENAPVLRALLYNGLHIDSISAEMLVELIEFFNLYVGDLPPEVPPVARVLIEVGLAGIFGSGMELPAGSYDGLSVEDARAAFEAEPPIEVLFEQGATAPNLPVSSFRSQFESWPPETTEPVSFYFDGGDGSFALSREQPTETTTASFVTNPAEGQVTTATDLEAIWTDEPAWDWVPAGPENQVSAASDPLPSDLVLVGNLSADLWISVADGSDADLEVTISEVAPDGSETYVQSGWLRLSRRGLSDEATELRPVISGTEDAVAPVDAGGEPVLARVEVLPFAHVFRAGSRLRITIDTPGGSKPRWRFEVAEPAVGVTVHAGPDTPSKIVLPVIPGIEVPTERPACGSLRGQPCRPG